MPTDHKNLPSVPHFVDDMFDVFANKSGAYDLHMYKMYKIFIIMSILPLAHQNQLFNPYSLMNSNIYNATSVTFFAYYGIILRRLASGRPIAGTLILEIFGGVSVPFSLRFILVGGSVAIVFYILSLVVDPLHPITPSELVLAFLISVYIFGILVEIGKILKKKIL